MAIRHFAILCSASALAFGLVVPVCAQALTDPMRPPQMSARGDAEDTAAPTRLQSVLISRGRKVAVIDGKTVPLGGAVGDATLVAIGQTEVVLQKGAERETLKFTQSVQIKPVPRLAPAKGPK